MICFGESIRQGVAYKFFSIMGSQNENVSEESILILTHLVFFVLFQALCCGNNYQEGVCFSFIQPVEGGL